MKYLTHPNHSADQVAEILWLLPLDCIDMDEVDQWTQEQLDNVYEWAIREHLLSEYKLNIEWMPMPPCVKIMQPLREKEGVL